MIALALVHMAVELSNLVLEQFLFNRAHAGHSLVVRTKQLHKFVDVLRVVLVLKGDVDNRVGDLPADAVEEFGLADDHFQLRVEVYAVVLVLSLANCVQNRLL